MATAKKRAEETSAKKKAQEEAAAKKIAEDPKTPPPKKKAKKEEVLSGVKDAVYTAFLKNEISQNEATDDSHLVRVPLKDSIYLDSDGKGGTVLLNVLTREKVLLPGFPWTIITDDDLDPSMIVYCDLIKYDTVIHDIDELLLKHLYYNSLTGERITIQLGVDGEDPARRFVHLVDAFYDRNVKLVISAAAPIASLYQGQKLRFEFERTCSRLLEMQSEEYLARPHLP